MLARDLAFVSRSSRADPTPVAVAGREIHFAVDWRDPRAASSTTLIVSTNSCASHRAQKRRLPIVLLIETRSAACC
jgi:hypothetical protein